jgi:hypothetical protein
MAAMDINSQIAQKMQIEKPHLPSLKSGTAVPNAPILFWYTDSVAAALCGAIV